MRARLGFDGNRKWDLKTTLGRILGRYGAGINVVFATKFGGGTMMAKGATASAVNPDWVAMFGSLLNAETLGMATFVYAVAFVAFWLGWYAPAPILSRSITRLFRKP